MSSFKASDKVWVYTSKNKFTEDQKSLILAKGKQFLDGWESHGDKVKGEIAIAYDHFIIVISDDCGGNMCGRAKDAQVKFVQEVGNELEVDLLDRMQLAYRSMSGEVEVKNMPAFKAAMKSGFITSSSTVFNNMVTTFGEFQEGWEVTVQNSWHKQWL